MLITISAYTEKVKAGKYTFPDFHECCPICHGKGCAVRIGYYYRNAIQIQEKAWENFLHKIPVARFQCRRIRKPKYKHRTFSLLPDNLIPYYPYTIDTLIFTILQILLNNSTDKALESIDKVSPEEMLLSEKTLNRFLNIFHKARLKLILFSRKRRNKNNTFPDLENYTEIEILHFIMEFSDLCFSDVSSNARKLSLFYYSEEGSYINNAHFLFGTAYQFRK